MSSAIRSTNAKIKRGAAPSRGRAIVKAKRPKRKDPTRVHQLLLFLRITPKMIERFTMLFIFAGLLTCSAVAANYFGVPRVMGSFAAEAVARAGFAVKRVEITGINHMDRMIVDSIALDHHSMSMASIDLTAIRKQLLAYSWIEEARVSRRLPDTLVIDLTERKPMAVWQHNEKLSLVDGNGIVLASLTSETMPTDLPLVIGPDANVQSASLKFILSRAPRLKPLISGATWVGNRRWDLRFQTGETLALPEGDNAAARALAAFADTDARSPLLGKGYLHFDTRDGQRLYIRLAHGHSLDKVATPGAKAG